MLRQKRVMCALALSACVGATLLSCAPAKLPRVISESPEEAILTVHAVLLLTPPKDAMIAELYDFFVLVSDRAATGEISAGWAAYIYTNYYRDLLRDRPSGSPRLDSAGQRKVLADAVEFFYIRKRPEAQPQPYGAWVWQAAPTWESGNPR